MRNQISCLVRATPPGSLGAVPCSDSQRTVARTAMLCPTAGLVLRQWWYVHERAHVGYRPAPRPADLQACFCTNQDGLARHLWPRCDFLVENDTLVELTVGCLRRQGGLPKETFVSLCRSLCKNGSLEVLGLPDLLGQDETDADFFAKMIGTNKGLKRIEITPQQQALNTSKLNLKTCCD